MLELAAKPVPLMATGSPTAPEVGLMVIWGETVKVSVSLLVVALVSWAFTVWLPLVLSGTVRLKPEKVPVAVAVVVPILVESKRMVIPALA